MVFQFFQAGFRKVRALLRKTGSYLGDRLRTLFQGPVDEERLEQLEQLFYEADLGVTTAVELTAKVRKNLRKNPEMSAEECIALVREELLSHFPEPSKPLRQGEALSVYMVVGVNGNGKTTTVAKLAKRFIDQGERVILGAADTFRAAAMDQLEAWGKRLETSVVRGQPKADPASVVYDTLQAAQSRGYRIALLDTAGRLHTKTHLMQELDKMKRACQKVIPDSPHEILLVLDATTGQNAIDQAKIFHQYTPLTGLVLTKLDGTAKGGIVVRIQRELGIPIRFIGVGEGMEDLEPFDAKEFVEALLE